MASSPMEDSDKALLLECLRKAEIDSGLSHKPNDLKAIETCDRARDAVYRAVKKWPELPPEERAAYTSGCISNAVIDAFRRNTVRRKVFHDELDEQKTPDPSIISAEKRLDAQRKLRRVCHYLKHEIRPAFKQVILGDLEGKTDKEMAEELGVRLQVVKNRKFRARRELTEIFGEMQGELDA